MFACRQNSQKPGQALYAAFKASCANVSPRLTSAGQGFIPGTLQRSSLLSHASIGLSSIQRWVLVLPSLKCVFLFDVRIIAIAIPQDTAMSSLHFQHESSVDDELSTKYFTRPNDDLADDKEQGSSPKVLIDSWRLKPSPMEPNSNTFSSFTNQQPVYYTPPPGGINMFYHSQASDLKSSEIGINRPSTMALSVHRPHSLHPPMHLHHQNPHMLHYQNIVHNPSVQQQHH